MEETCTSIEDRPVIVKDRRCQPDRRIAWRGGRRDTDWISRPPDSLEQFAARRAPGRWRWLTLPLRSL
jgi:hypothetical protein